MIRHDLPGGPGEPPALARARRAMPARAPGYRNIWNISRRVSAAALVHVDLITCRTVKLSGGQFNARHVSRVIF